MSATAIERNATEGVVLTVLTHRKNGQIDDAIAPFAEEFTFKDRGIGLDFKDKERLAEFFQKTNELSPDSCLQIELILMSADCAVCEWTLQTTVTEPFYAGLSRKVQVLLPGVSVVRTKYGKITTWSDYYDGLTSAHSVGCLFHGLGQVVSEMPRLEQMTRGTKRSRPKSRAGEGV